MRIWLLTTEYPPYFGGGIATYARYTVQGLASRGHEVTVFLPTYEDGAECRESADGSARVVHFPVVLPRSLDSLQDAARLSYAYACVTADYIRREGPPDVIESQDYLGIAQHLLQLKWTFDPVFQHVPVVITAHSPKFVLDPIDHTPSYQLPGYWTQQLEKFSLRAADRVIFPSRYLQDAVARVLPGLPSQVIPNPYVVPVEVPPVGSSLLYFGRVQHLKGVLVMLEALHNLWENGFPYPLDLVGGDHYFRPRGRWMTDYIQSRYPDDVNQGRIRFRGLLPPDEAQRELGRAGIVVVPSLFENLPYSVIEAMSLGRVVVASDTGGQRELIESGDNGFLFRGQQPADLQARLQEAFALSEGSREAMGLRARERIQRYCGVDRILDLKEAVFASLRPAAQSPRRQFPLIEARPPLPAISRGLRELTVVVPYFNLGSLVEETVQSLKAVSDIDMEILVVDDGSTDPESLSALYRLYDEHRDVTVLRTPNQGLARARNYGAAVSHGTYIAFLDADDLVDPAYYPTALQILKAYDNIAFVGCWTQYFGAADEIWVTWNPEPPYIFYRNSVNSSALIFRREDFLHVAPNNPDLVYGYEDYGTVAKLVANGYPGVVIPKPWFQYRVRRDSMSRGFNLANRLYSKRIFVETIPEAYQRYGAELYSLQNANGPDFMGDNPTKMGPWFVATDEGPEAPH